MEKKPKNKEVNFLKPTSMFFHTFWGIIGIFFLFSKFQDDLGF